MLFDLPHVSHLECHAHIEPTAMMGQCIAVNSFLVAYFGVRRVMQCVGHLVLCFSHVVNDGMRDLMLGVHGNGRPKAGRCAVTPL